MSFTSPSYAEIGACGNRPLPSDKIRKLQRSSIRLECSANADHYVRYPQPFKGQSSYDEWAGIQNQKDRQLYRLDPATHPDIKWSGVIPYQTIEKWTWVDWVYGADPICGYDTIRSCSRDSQGNQTCTETKVMKSCWHDETQYESRPCSTEKLSYTAEFKRPISINGKSPNNWNPSHPDYYDVIPNKYDLLPGEAEVIQTSSNTGLSQSIQPTIKIGDAWNKYTTQIAFENGARSINCDYNNVHERVWNFDVTIHTEHRIKKPSPNAFSVPSGGVSKAMRRSLIDAVGEEDLVPYEPQVLTLVDTSHRVISTMSRQSRDMTTQIEKAKVEVGKGSNEKTTDVAESAKVSGFFKDTQVKVRLVEVTNMLSFNRNPTQPLYLSGSEVALGDNYELDVYDPNYSDYDLYRSKGPFDSLFGNFYDMFRVKLRKNTDYKIMVSMYQKNVPFYNQKDDCNGLLDGEDCYFSKELPVEFKTNNADNRPVWQKIYECWSAGISRKGVCLQW